MNWLITTCLLLVLAFLLQLGYVVYALYVLLAGILVSRYLARHWTHHLSAEREVNRLIADVGDTVAVMVKVTNRGTLPVVWCLAEDVLPRKALVHESGSLTVDGRRTGLLMLPGGRSRSLLYQVNCRRRGYYQIGPLVLETGDLFGLYRRYRVVTRPEFLLVLPQVFPLEGYDVHSRRPIGEVRMTYRLYEDPTRIAGVRAYQPGDPLNRVHWRATARTGELHSKVYEPSSVAGATLLLEFHLASYDPAHEPFRSELAITAAASIGHTLYEMGQQVGLMTNARDAADRIRKEGWAGELYSRLAAHSAVSMRETSDRLRPVSVETRRGADQLLRMLETLARLEMTDGLTFPQLVEETAGRAPRDATVLAILPQVTPEWATALANLRRSGYAVAVILNVFDDFEFSRCAGLLLAESIDVYHLRDEADVVNVCRRLVLR